MTDIASALLTALIIATQARGTTITTKNNCPFTVWPGKRGRLASSFGYY